MKYPRIGRIDKVRAQGLCRVCYEPKSDRRVHIEYTYMRGDDDVFKAHAECLPKFKGDLTRYIYGKVDETQGMENTANDK